MPIYMGPRRSSKYVGERNVPHDVLRRRKGVHDIMRRMGSPVLVKHRWNDLDVKKGVAVESPNFDPVYGQSRNLDPLSHGVGYHSVELSKNEWYHITTGEIVVADRSPGVEYAQAPLYRGFGRSNLTYIIEPDRSEDFFKIVQGGPLFKVQTATAIAPWWPDISDNDLIIDVILDRAGNPVSTGKRYEAKQVSPVAMRGLDRRGRLEYTEDAGNRHVINQTFEMALIPSNDVLYDVEWDR